MTINPMTQPLLPPNTIIPDNEDLFIPYMTRLYEDIAYAVNSKDPNYYPMGITDIATNILNVPNFGAFIICVSASNQAPDGSYPPTITASLCKSSASVAGQVVVLGSQAGQGGGVWGGATLTISSTATNFQIMHSVASVTGNFNIRLIYTQG